MVKENAVAITCGNETDRRILQEAVQDKLGSQVNIHETKVEEPVIKIVDIADELTEDKLIQCLVNQNKNLKLGKNKLHVRKLYKAKKTFSAIIQVNSEMAESILNQQKVKIQWSMCRVFHHIDVRRCYQCYGFNHKANVCKNRPTCKRCGEEKHEEEEDCGISCINCKMANQKLNLMLDTNHSVFDRKCPVYERQVENKARRINWEKK